MTRRISAYLPLALLALTVTAPAIRAEDGPVALAIGVAAPMKDAKMMNVDGRVLTLAEAAGKKGTLVFFTCNACPWAKMWQTRVAEIGNTAAKQGIGVIAINSNDPDVNAEDSYEEMKARAAKLGLKFPYVVDATSDVARAFGATRTPEAFLFDAKGVLVYHGTIDDNARDAAAVKQPYLKKAVTAVATGRKVATAETKSLGCGIKFRKA